jgi:hypothetical protein
MSYAIIVIGILPIMYYTNKYFTKINNLIAKNELLQKQITENLETFNKIQINYNKYKQLDLEALNEIRLYCRNK